MKRIILFFSLVLITNCGSYAQSKELEPIFVHPSGESFVSYVTKNIKRNVIPNFRDYCFIRIGFAKFQIDSTGLIDEITFSKSIPSVLTSYFREAINSTQGYWSPKIKNGRAVKSSPILLPIEIKMEAGCFEKKDTDLENLNFLAFPESSLSNFECKIIGQPLVLHSNRGRVEVKEINEGLYKPSPTQQNIFTGEWVYSDGSKKFKIILSNDKAVYSEASKTYSDVVSGYHSYTNGDSVIQSSIATEKSISSGHLLKGANFKILEFNLLDLKTRIVGTARLELIPGDEGKARFTIVPTDLGQSRLNREDLIFLKNNGQNYFLIPTDVIMTKVKQEPR
jgi:hypothetical protein